MALLSFEYQRRVKVVISSASSRREKWVTLPWNIYVWLLEMIRKEFGETGLVRVGHDKFCLQLRDGSEEIAPAVKKEKYAFARYVLEGEK